MFLSVFEIFKIGIGPSSSHTVGPMVAAARFLGELQHEDLFDEIERVEVRLYGSLAFTGKGHASDQAILLGLKGEKPDQINSDLIPDMVETIHKDKQIALNGKHVIGFDPETDIIFDYGPALPHHANGMRFLAYSAAGLAYERDYYSVGGGFVQDETEISKTNDFAPHSPRLGDIPYDFDSGKLMLAMGKEHGLSIAQMVRANELTKTTEDKLNQGLDKLIAVMEDTIARGLKKTGILPGGLGVKRRAESLHKQLENNQYKNSAYPHDIMDQISLYALSVNEENAAGGQVVTAPTNGAAGIIPAVLHYYRRFCTAQINNDQALITQKSHDFMLTAAAIGSLIKHNASISGAEVGCQGEVGSAAAMAAAGLTAALGGTNEQIENAAEIALEHHLGMTCDPIGGLVQIPCIERNAMGAIKAVNAASLSLKGDGIHHVSLDAAILTMWETGKDMNSKYKETSQGGLALNAVSC